jgi:separase
MAFRLTSQTGRAEEAFSAALEYVLPSTWDAIAKKAASHSISETFSSAQKGDPLEECGHLIKMAYELQVFDLMKVERGEETILDRVITQCSLPNLAKGAVVEYCLSALHRHSHRAEYPKAYFALLDIVEGIYSQGQTPLRLARIKMLRLESLLLQGRQAKDEEVQAIQGALQILFDCKQLHEDGQLIRYQRQYRSRCALYEAILSYDSDGTQENIIRAVELLSVQAKETKVKGEKSAAVAKKETLRPSSAPRQADTRAPKTPTGARGRGIAKVDAKTAHVDATATAIYDEPEKIIQLCELLVEMCSVDGTTTSCIHLIEAGRTIAEHTQDTDAWLRLSTGLAQQHLVAGHTLKALRICDKIGEALQDSSQSVDSYSRYLFCRAECHSRLGQQEKAVKIYESASLLAHQTDAKQKTSSSSIHGALQRVLLCERQAMAFSVTAQIYFASGLINLALQSGLNGVRAAMRAGMSLTRLTTSNDSNKEPSPFEPLDGTEILEQGGACRRISAFSSMNLASMHWRSVNALQGAYMRISQLYCIRGSAKDAEGFAGEAIDFARKTGARRALKLALLERGGLRIRMGQLTKAMEDVDAAIAVPDARPNPPLAAVLAHVQGDHRARTGCYTEAAEMFAEGRRLLCELKACDRGNPVELDDPSRVIIPLLQATLTHREAWLLHKMNDEQRLSNLLQEYDHRKLGLGSAELSLVRAMMAVQQASKAFQHDQLLSLVPDAVITLPSAVERGPSSQRSDVKASKTALCHLREAVAHLDRIIESSSKQCTSAVVLREARSQRLMCSILVSALDQEQEEERIDLLTTSSALTLELELEEAIENKLAVATRDNTGKSWPSFTPEIVSKKAIPRRATSPSKRGAVSASEESSEGEQDTEGRQIWMAVRERRAQAIDMALPSNWTVVSISLSADRRCLLMERRSGKRGAIMFSIPIDRQSRREGEEGALQVDAVLEELRDIVDESNTATHAAHELDGLEGRKAWWTRRRELDNRLRSLLTAIDSTWLGAFRCVLAPAIDSDSNGLAALRRCMCDILTNACFPNANSKKSFGVELNTDALDLFSALDMTNCSDEDLEDLIHFAMDAFQLHGVPVAVDEIDLDVCVTDLRAALDSFQARRTTPEKGEDSDDHLFLVLDKDLSGIPWESIPSLRARAICRIPSLAMLQDRLAMDPQGRLSVDLKKAKKHYLLNPSQELTRTQDRFAPLFEDSKADKGATRWRGIAGRSPTMEEYGKALESSDLLLYFGHGGAEQYVRPSRLRGMMRCAVTMLWGCSSGALRDMGDFDRTGTPYNYLMAGCPSLVSLLWDATDKELDGVSESVLRLSGVIQDGGRPVSIARAVAQSRDACKLPYLTGAACVVYGVPVYFSR